jgi:GT2 family glycosyltransferase
MGQRPEALERAVNSAIGLVGEPIEILVIGNGADVPALASVERTLRLPENVGIPAGRNVGAANTTADVILFLDDDGWYPDTNLGEHVRRAFAQDPNLAVLSMRIVDPEGGEGQQRHVPRAGRSDASRSSDVTTFLGGACAIRRTAFEQVGGYADDFFFGHEESDLAWRLLDAGWRITYDAEATMCHPSVPASRHADFYRLNARNRVWLVRRNLPAPLAVGHMAVWAGITGVRLGPGEEYRTWWAGVREGLRTEAGPRHPIRWSTAWKMTKLGRPPLL